MSDATRSADFADFILSQDDEQWHAVGHGLIISIDNDAEKPMCHQRAIKKSLQKNEAIHDSVLRCELDGVMVYVKPGHIVITKRKLHL